MWSTLELAIGIDSDSDKDVDAILDALYSHIRASRNVAIDRVDFEKRVQCSGEKFDKFLRGILELRNTPKSHGKSPAELIYNRPLRSHVPSMMPNHVTEHIQQRSQASKENYDRTARELPPLRVSSILRVLQLNGQRREKTSRKSMNFVAVQEGDECILIYSLSSFNPSISCS